MKRVLLLLIMILLCGGCFFDPYKNEDDAVKAVNEWFSFKNGKDDLGKTRRDMEEIHTIKNVTCKYIEKDDYMRYVYNCELSYIPQGITIVPLAKEAKKNVYVVVMYNDDRTYNYVVYNSNSEKDIWKRDEIIKYGKER